MRWFESSRPCQMQIWIKIIRDLLAQPVEHLTFNQGVDGSSPSWVTIHGPVVQLVRMPPCHGGGRGFESLPGRHFFISPMADVHASVAQSVEQRTENPRVGSSILP